MRLNVEFFYAFLAIFGSSFLFSQNDSLKYFSSPVKIPIYLAGNFGEIRTNHFHTGIDIKTQQKEGIEVYAVADGYVSRIHVSPWGYGKAVYVAHPNGKTSLYGHLQKFAPKIEQFVKYHQYKNMSYEVDLILTPNDIAISKNELLAFSGNTGGSSGPHLHFEIRDSETTNAENPANYGFGVKDSSKPVVERLYVYPLDASSYAMGKNKPSRVSLRPQRDGSWLADTVKAEGTIGFGIGCFDKQDGSANRNGCHSVLLKINGIPYLAYKFDMLSFDKGNYVNTFIDYELYTREGVRVQKCFISPHNKLEIYDKKSSNGSLFVQDGLSYSVQIELKDIKGNTTLINIPVEGKHIEPVLTNLKQQEQQGHQIFTEKDYFFNMEAASVYFPPEAFFEDTTVLLKDTLRGIKVSNKKTAIKTSYTIKFDVSEIDERQRSKLFVARLSPRKEIYENSYLIGENMLACRTNKMGIFRVSRDITSAKIIPLLLRRKKNHLQKETNTIRFRIFDNESGIKSYNAYVNGDWFLMEYEPKNQIITGNLKDIADDGSQELEFSLVVEDKVGNKSTFRTKLRNRTQKM